MLFVWFTVWINCSSDLKQFSWLLEQFFLTVGQNNFGNKIQPFLKKEIQVYSRNNAQNMTYLFLEINNKKGCIFIFMNSLITNNIDTVSYMTSTIFTKKKKNLKNYGLFRKWLGILERLWNAIFSENVTKIGTYLRLVNVHKWCPILGEG